MTDEHPLSEQDAINQLDALDGSDGENHHHEADNILLAVAPPGVREAYHRLIGRAEFWAHA